MPGPYAVLAVRRAPAAVRDALAGAGVHGQVGADADGWTGAWDLDTDPALLADLLAEQLDAPAVAVEVRDGVLTLVVSAPGRDLEPYRSDQRGGADLAGLAAGYAAACGRSGATDALAQALRDPDLDPVDRHAAVSRLLGLPEALVGGPRSGGEAVTVGPGGTSRPAGAGGTAGGAAPTGTAGRTAAGAGSTGTAGLVLVQAAGEEVARAAADAGDDGWAVPYDGSWSAFVPELDETSPSAERGAAGGATADGGGGVPPDGAAAAVRSTGATAGSAATPGDRGGERIVEVARRVVPPRRTGLALWWGTSAGGFALLVGGEVVARHTWPGMPPDAERADALAVALTDLVGTPRHRDEVAALLRRPGDPAALLATLVGLLSVPDVVVGASPREVRAGAQAAPGTARVGTPARSGSAPPPPSTGGPSGARPPAAGPGAGPGGGTPVEAAAPTPAGPAGGTPAATSAAGTGRSPSTGMAAFAAVFAVVALVLGLLRVLRWLQGDEGTFGVLLGAGLLAVSVVEAATVARWLRARRRAASSSGGTP